MQRITVTTCLFLLLMAVLIPPAVHAEHCGEDENPLRFLDENHWDQWTEGTWLEKLKIHGFVSQSYIATSGNNYMATTRRGGSFSFFETAVNGTYQIADDLRIGGQVYMSEYGKTGNWIPVIDWACIDWRWKDCLGFRIGKYKMRSGLYSDTQDIPFVNQWILVPQGNYPRIYRELTVSAWGMNMYGDIPIGRLGDISYEFYFGKHFHFDEGGLSEQYRDRALDLRNLEACSVGFDIRWRTPIEGLMLGGSLMYLQADMTSVSFSAAPVAGILSTYGERFILDFDCLLVHRLYAKYQWEKWTFFADYQSFYQNGRGKQNLHVFGSPSTKVPSVYTDQDAQAYGLSLGAIYELTDKLSLGGYYCYYLDNEYIDNDIVNNYSHDFCFSARYNITNNLILKGEAHYINGAGFPGVYGTDNPSYQRDWLLFAISISYNF